LRQEIRSHTGLRGIAALFVVGYHQKFVAGYKLPFEHVMFGRAYLMVDLFFVLSGFIISYVYHADRRLSRGEVKSFLLARLFRIYPLHVFALMFLTACSVAVAAAHHRHQELGGDWLRQLLLLNAWIPSRVEWNVPSWSISAEAFAYVLYPLIVLLAVARPTLVRLAMLIGALTFYSYVTATTGSLDILVGLAPLRCLAGFMIGMLIFYYRERSAAGFLQLVAVAWIVAALALPVNDVLVIPAFASLVFLTWRDTGPAARLLSSKLLQWLGKVSYSVYLMHVPVGFVLWLAWYKLELRLGLPPAIARAIWLTLIFAAVLAASAVTQKYIEKPCQDALKRWTKRPKPGEPAIAAP